MKGLDKNTVIGFVLLVGLVVAFMWYNGDKAQKQAEIDRQEQLVADSIAQVERIKDSIEFAAADTLPKRNTTVAPTASLLDNATGADSLKSLRMQQMYGGFAGAIDGDEQIVVLENNLMKLELSSLGGQVKRVMLKGYKSFNGDSLYLIDGHNDYFGYIFRGVDNQTVETRHFHYTAGDVVKSASEQSVDFMLQSADGGAIVHRYVLKNDSYFLDFNTEFVNALNVVSANETNIMIDWQAQPRLQERKASKEREYTAVYFADADLEVDYHGETKEFENKDLATSLKWLGFKQQFFTNALIADKEIANAKISVQALGDTTEELKVLHTTAYLNYPRGDVKRGRVDDVNYDFQFYLGPNDYKALKKHDLALEGLIPMGGRFLGAINKGLILNVFTFLEKGIGSYGLIIFLLAVFIKIILTPLTYRSYKSQAKMRVLKPEIDALKAKHEGDASKLQMAQMQLYRQSGVNAMGGCIPMLLQMPILISMYRFFPTCLNLRQEGFLWAQDFSNYDAIVEFAPVSLLVANVDHISLFTILMAISSFFYTRMNQQMSPTSGAMAQQMKYMQYFMPFMLIFIFNNFASGLTFYYLCYNVLSFVQQFVFKRFIINEDAIRAKIEEKKSAPKKKSRWDGFQKRLEEAQRQQAQRKK